MSRLKVYQYGNCGTCKKALKWLDAQGLQYDPVDITQTPPSKRELQTVLSATGLPIRKLFNTSGVAYREGSYGKRLEGMSDEEALAELAANGRLVKRPIVLGRNVALVGFREQEYEDALGG